MRNWNGWAPWPLRLILGFGFIYHGSPKLFTSEGHQNFAGTMQGMGVPAAELMAWVVGAIEVFGGLALMLGGPGLYTQLSLYRETGRSVCLTMRAIP